MPGIHVVRISRHAWNGPQSNPAKLMDDRRFCSQRIVTWARRRKIVCNSGLALQADRHVHEVDARLGAAKNVGTRVAKVSEAQVGQVPDLPSTNRPLTIAESIT